MQSSRPQKFHRNSARLKTCFRRQIHPSKHPRNFPLIASRGFVSTVNDHECSLFHEHRRGKKKNEISIKLNVIKRLFFKEVEGKNTQHSDEKSTRWSLRSFPRRKFFSYCPRMAINVTSTTPPTQRKAEAMLCNQEAASWNQKRFSIGWSPLR